MIKLTPAEFETALNEHRYPKVWWQIARDAQLKKLVELYKPFEMYDMNDESELTCVMIPPQVWQALLKEIE